MTSDGHAGALVRRWRTRRHRSQLDVAVSAGISTRHLSYVETGRSTPSRAMIERICDELDVPLRDRNEIYLAAGLAPAHPERPLTDLGPARAAVDAVLAGHEPNPAVAVNVRWDVLAANRAMQRFLADLPPALAGPALAELLAELESYPPPPGGDGDVDGAADDVAVPLRLAVDGGELSFLYTVTVFGSPQNVTLDEIAVETFFPADDATREALAALAG